MPRQFGADDATGHQNWTSIKIFQRLTDGKYLYSMEIDETLISSYVTEVENPQEFTNVKVYACKHHLNVPWKGSIRKFEISIKDNNKG